MSYLAKHVAATLGIAAGFMLGSSAALGGATNAGPQTTFAAMEVPTPSVIVPNKGEIPDEGTCQYKVSPGPQETFDQLFAALVDCERPAWTHERREAQVDYLVGVLQESLPCIIDWHDLPPGLSVRVVVANDEEWSIDLRNSGLEQEC